ncbi:hypothetical protein ACN469_01840 [Corallococcus terminator]
MPSEKPDAGSPPSQVERPSSITLGEVLITNVEGTEMSMQVLGVGFVPFSRVLLDEQGLETTFVSDTELRARVPAWHPTIRSDSFFEVWAPSASGQYRDGIRSARIPFTVSPPQLTSVTPDTLESEPAEAVQITVRGKNLLLGSHAIFRDRPYPLTVTSPHEGSFWLPPSALKAQGGRDALVIEVTRPRTARSEPLPLTLTSPAPVITGVWPPTLNATDLHHGNAGSAPDRIIVSGLQVRSNTVVRWNGTPLTTTTYDGKNRVQAQLPITARVQVGTVQVSLETPGPDESKQSSSHALAVRSEPVLHAVSPAWVLAGSEEVSFQLRGEGLGISSAQALFWNGHRIERLSGPSSQGSWSFNVPAALLAQPGTIPVTVKRDFDGAVSAPLFVQVIAQPPSPIAHSLLPSVLSVGDAPGLLYVMGTSFTPQSVILVDGQERPSRLHGPSQLSIQLQAEDLATKGVRTITVKTPAPGGGTTLPLLLVVHAERPMPIIEQVSSDVGQLHALAGGGVLRLRVEGQGFSPLSVVRWNGQALPTQWICKTPGTCMAGPGPRSTLWAEVPADQVAQPGVGRVTVFTPGPGGGESPEQFFVLAAAGQPIVTLSTSVVDVGASHEFYREVSIWTRVTGGSAQASVLFVDGVVREFSSPSTWTLSEAEVAAPRVHEIRTFTLGAGLSAPAYLRVQGALPPHLRWVVPGVFSQGEWAATEKRELFVTGENFFWLTGGSERALGTTLDWGDQSQSFAWSSVAWLEATTLEQVGARPLKVSRAAEGGGVSLPALLNVVSERPAPLLTHLEPMRVLRGAPALALRIKGQGIHSTTVLRWRDFRSSLKAVSYADHRLEYYEALLPAEALATAGAVDVTLETSGPGGGVSPPIRVVIEE